MSARPMLGFYYYYYYTYITQATTFVDLCKHIHYITYTADLLQEVMYYQLSTKLSMFPTHPELNMSGPRDSLYIERSYEFASSRL